MPLKYFVYHENNLEKPYIPQEDNYEVSDNVFVVSDGITHDLIDGFYPNPSDSGEVAKIICTTVCTELENTKKNIQDIEEAVEKANSKVKIFNETSEIYKNREQNGYTIGAAVFAAIVVKNKKLTYGLLDDCYFSIFSDDMVDHPKLKSFVDKSAKHFEENYDWSKPGDRKVWRKKYRNNELVIGGNKLGYGALDGRNGYESFVQYGDELLKPNDLICLYTDGFIKIMQDLDFVRKIKESDFSMKTLDYIGNYTREKGINKEKTCYFIKYCE